MRTSHAAAASAQDDHLFSIITFSPFRGGARQPPCPEKSVWLRALGDPPEISGNGPVRILKPSDLLASRAMDVCRSAHQLPGASLSRALLTFYLWLPRSSHHRTDQT